MHDFSKPVWFDLDGICSVKVFGASDLVGAVRRELNFYQMDPEKIPVTPDLEVELSRLSSFKPSMNPAHLPPFDFEDRHKLAKWAVRFERLGQPPHRIKFFGNYFSKMIVAKQILEPAIRWLSQPLGFIFVHSACLCKEGRGVLVAGGGGSGKTRLLLGWLSQGNPFLSDDFSILSFGEVRRYVTPLRVGARLLSESGAGKNLSAARLMEIYSRTALRRLLLNYAKLQAKLDVKELFPQIQILEKAQLKAAVVISGDDKTLAKIKAEDMAEQLVKINQAEMYGFARYLPELSARTNDPACNNFFIEQKNRLRSFLENIPCYRICSLRNFKKKDLDAILEKISGLFSP